MPAAVGLREGTSDLWVLVAGFGLTRTRRTLWVFRVSRRCGLQLIRLLGCLETLCLTALVIGLLTLRGVVVEDLLQTTALLVDTSSTVEFQAQLSPVTLYLRYPLPSIEIGDIILLNSGATQDNLPMTDTRNEIESGLRPLGDLVNSVGTVAIETNAVVESIRDQASESKEGVRAQIQVFQSGFRQLVPRHDQSTNRPFLLNLRRLSDLRSQSQKHGLFKVRLSLSIVLHLTPISNAKLTPRVRSALRLTPFAGFTRSLACAVRPSSAAGPILGK